MAGKVQNLEALLDELAEAAEGQQRVTVRRAHKKIGERSFGPLLVAPGLAAITPLGVIPGAPTVLAVVIVLIAGQLVIGRRDFWLPKIILDRSISAARLNKAVKAARPAARLIDRLLRPRLETLTGPKATRLVAVVCTVVALAIPPLELIPFAVIAPGTAVAAFGLGLISRDGLLVLLALVASAVALGLVGVSLFR